MRREGEGCCRPPCSVFMAISTPELTVHSSLVIVLLIGMDREARQCIRELCVEGVCVAQAKITSLLWLYTCKAKI